MVAFVALFYELCGVGGGQLTGRLCKLCMFILAGRLGDVERELAGLDEG